MSEQITVEDAERRIRADYWDDVRSVCDDVKQAIKDGHITDPEGVHDYLHETVDGCSRVIYTGRAILGLFASDNDNAYFEEMGEAFPGYSVLMYHAMLADCRDTLGDLDDLFSEEETEGEE